MYRSSLLLSLFMLVGYCTYAQKPVTKNTTKAATQTRKLLVPQAYLGNSDFKGGPIKRDMFCSLLRQGITSKDSTGNKYKVAGFEFAYFERMIYEDSLGNLMPVNDYMSEYCLGDTLSPGIAGSIYQRVKPGDTLYINRVSVIKSGHSSGEENRILGAGFKCFIIK